MNLATEKGEWKRRRHAWDGQMSQCEKKWVEWKQQMVDECEQCEDGLHNKNKLDDEQPRTNLLLHVNHNSGSGLVQSID